MIPRVLTIAGSDSGGGAGIQADLKTLAALGVFGTSALTAVTAQNTRGVTQIQVLPADLVRAQIDAVISDIGADAVKTGMLATEEIVQVVAERLEALAIERLVVDPVMRAANGDPLLERDAERALVEELLPLAEITTPNSFEAAAMAGMEVRTVADMEEAARRISQLTRAAVVVKGGRLGGESSVDILLHEGAVHRLESPRLFGPRGGETHGAGCCFSAAIAAKRALGLPLVDAVREAKRFVTAAIRRSVEVGSGVPPVQPIPVEKGKGSSEGYR